MKLKEEMYVPLVTMRIVREKEIPYGTREIDNPQKVVALVKELLDGADKELMIAISVDTKCKPVAVEVVAIGRLNQLATEPKDIFKHAILTNAYGIILVHNHPSGNPEPSEDDRKFTKIMKDVGEFLGVRLLDHLIIGEDNLYYSFGENENKEK